MNNDDSEHKGNKRNGYLSIGIIAYYYAASLTVVSHDFPPTSAFVTPPYITQVQSHVANIVQEISTMRLPLLFLISILSLCAFCVTRSAAYKAVTEIENLKQHRSYEITRGKREVEEFYNDDEYSQSQSQESQEEPGFWDRVVKIALKFFNRFIEWLNSS